MSPTPLMQRLAEHVADDGGKLALICLGVDGEEVGRYTYSILLRDVLRFAAQYHWTNAPMTVAVSSNSSYMFTCGILGAFASGRTAVPTLSVGSYEDQRRPGRRTAMLASVSAADVATDRFTLTPNGHGRQLMSVDLDRTALIQFTSGSTGLPKGARIGHTALSHNLSAIVRAFDLSHESTWVTWLPMFHDMGLIGSILAPLYAGATIISIPPRGFVANPLIWLEAISKYRGTGTAAPDFAYRRCVDRLGHRSPERLALGSLKVAVNGAERVRRHTLERFSEYFAPNGFDGTAFHPSYGLAEATLLVSTSLWTPRCETDVLAIPTTVSCGQPAQYVDAAIMDPDSGEALGDNTLGEIWVGGDCLMSGYENAPSATRDRLVPRPGPAGGQQMLRTRDAGLMRDSALYIVGRLDGMVAWNGLKYDAESIEDIVYTLDPRVSVCLAFNCDDATSDGVSVAYEIEKGRTVPVRPFEADVRRAVARALGLRVARVVPVQRGTIRRTTSGKVERGAGNQLACTDAVICA